MLHLLSQFLIPVHTVWPVVIIAALAGLTFWLAGARFNRAVATLLGVLLGGWIGMELPHWLNWSISGMGPAVAGAVVLGLSGFLLHRVWIGLGLGLLLATLAAVVAWYGWGHDIAVPQSIAGVGSGDQWLNVWTQLSLRLGYMLPVAIGLGLFAGVSLALLWFRLALVLLYSLGGVSLLAGLWLIVGSGFIYPPNWLAARPTVQAAIFCGLVLIGALLQWCQTPRPAGAVSRDEPYDAWDDD